MTTLKAIVAKLVILFIVIKNNLQQYKLNRLGRIKLVTPLLVSVDFSDNPSAIKPARLALEQSKLNVSVRQEGAVLYISIPRITRERRENLANVASKKLLNEYKKALNEVNLSVIIIILEIIAISNSIRLKKENLKIVFAANTS